MSESHETYVPYQHCSRIIFFHWQKGKILEAHVIDLHKLHCHYLHLKVILSSGITETKGLAVSCGVKFIGKKFKDRLAILHNYFIALQLAKNNHESH